MLRVNMPAYLFCLLLALAATAAAQTSRTAKHLTLDNRGHKLSLTLYPAVSAAKRSEPVVVFESGLGNDSTVWSQVIDRLPGNLSLVSYDRPGLGKSEADGQTPTASHIAEVLHSALTQVSQPPYLLVGHSWGGARVRAFAGMYPDEVAGLVFVDPTYFNGSDAGDQREIFDPMGLPHGQEELKQIERENSQQPGTSPALRAEIEVALDSAQKGFPDVTSRPMPPVPLVVLLAMQYESVKPGTMPFDYVRWREAVLSYRIKVFSKFVRDVPEGTLVTDPISSHFIESSDPEIVVWAIDRVLHAGMSRR